jgi:hypothetical protein
MNSNWKRNLLVIAAAVAATAATASAQETTLKATVPFAFSIDRSVNLAPGNYVVARQGDIWWFRSEDTAQSAAIVAQIRVPGQATEKPSLTFNCVRGHCQIRAIHAGAGAVGAEVPAPKLSKSDKEELAVVNVPLEPYRSE